MIFVTTNGTRAIAGAARRIRPPPRPSATPGPRHLEASGRRTPSISSARARGRFNVEDFLGAATVLSRMDVDGYRLNDGALLALDFAERHEENVYETLKRSRAGRWFVENDRMDAFDFVADIDASDLIPEVVGGSSDAPSSTSTSETPGGVGAWEKDERDDRDSGRRGLRPRSDRALSAGTRR